MSLSKYGIKNEKVLDLLEKFRYTYREVYRPEETNLALSDLEGLADLYTGDEEMNRIIGMGEDHDGAASNAFSYAIKPEFYRGEDSTKYRKTWSSLDEEIRIELGLKHSALSQLYPPGGYIGWHNNANAAAHNLIFTWSETGDGWFKYIEPKTNELITIQDEKGWNLKAGYFGAYGSGDVVYHAARTNCYRMTLSYVMAHDENYWQDCIDYVTQNRV